MGKISGLANGIDSELLSSALMRVCDMQSVVMGQVLDNHVYINFIPKVS